MFWVSVGPGEQTPEQFRNSLQIVELPDRLMLEATALYTLTELMGFRRSALENVSILGDGQRIPLMSYGLVEYVMALELSQFEVLELGGGDSTEFWSKRVKTVLTLEQDTDYAKTLKDGAAPNVEVRVLNVAAAAAQIRALERTFDIIVIDIAGNRFKCAKAALPLLKPGGFIVLDNSDWYPNTAGVLRDGGLIQIDFHDFRPRHYERGCSSLFLTPQFRPRPRLRRMPQPSIGGKDTAAQNRWDMPG